MSDHGKKIIIVGPAYPFRGGIANFTDSLYAELIKSYNVKVYTFIRQYPSFLFPGKTQYESDFSEKKIYAAQAIDSINPLNWKKAGRQILNEQPDVVIFTYWLPFFGPCFGTIAGILKKNEKIKMLALCHNIIPHEKRPGDRAFTSYFFKKVNYYLLLSKSVVSELKQFKYDAKYKVIPHPVYDKFGNTVAKEEARAFLNLSDEKLILFFGLIRNYKGLDTLLNAMPVLKQKNIRLIVAGEFYSDKEKYLDMIEKLNINDSVNLHDHFIPSSEVKYYFSACDAVILPYREATQSGIVQIAINFRKPMIATDVGGMGEVIRHGETGYVVEKENPAQLSEAIIKFYEQNDELKFQNNLEHEADKYSWSLFVKRMFELVENQECITIR